MYLIMYLYGGARRNLQSFRMIPGLVSGASGALMLLSRSWSCFGALLGLLVGLFAPLERFALEPGLSDLDFARPDSSGTPWTSFLEAETG